VNDSKRGNAKKSYGIAKNGRSKNLFRGYNNKGGKPSGEARMKAAEERGNKRFQTTRRSQ